MVRMVKARIRRMGKNWASCGVPVSPPIEMRRDPSMTQLCPKLVPGQVIEVPEDHNLLNQECVEIVRGLERDEFMRPWVFPTAEAAIMADPSKSMLTADAIASGLALAEGATMKGKKALVEREAAQRTAREMPDEDVGYNDASDDYMPNPRNRVSRVEADEMRQVSEEITPRRLRETLYEGDPGYVAEANGEETAEEIPPRRRRTPRGR